MSLSVGLEDPPKAEELFHSMFFSEEIPKAPSHHRQQRWNRRRIQKRWSWKRGRERRRYEERAEFLKLKWLEMRREYEVNQGSLGTAFLSLNSDVRIDDKKDEDKDTPETAEAVLDAEQTALIRLTLNPDADNESTPSSHSVASSAGREAKQRATRNKSQRMSKLEGRRKHTRRREKIIERIAAGETLSDFADFAKFNHIYNPTDNEKDHLLFGGTQAHKSKKAKKAKKKRNAKPAKVVHLKHNRNFNHAALGNGNGNGHGNGSVNKRKPKEVAMASCSAVSLAAIQAEQAGIMRKLSFKKRQQIHGCGGFAMSQSGHKHRIRSLDHLAFREKTVREIYGGHSVFSCIPCSVEATNALLVDAALLEKALGRRGGDDGGIKRAIAKQLSARETLQVEVLPIFERAYIAKPCVHLLIVQFQQQEQALSLYQRVLQLKQGTGGSGSCRPKEWEQLRLEFAAKWFAQCDFLQHMHVWSDSALHSMVTVQHNNRQHAQSILRTARHCRCSSSKPHDANCLSTCCCCTYWAAEGADIAHGDQVLWHGTQCTVDCQAPVADEQQVRIQFEQEQDAKYVVALSSLQTTERSAEQTASDDFAFVTYVKHFWNISELQRKAKLI